MVISCNAIGQAAIDNTQAFSGDTISNTVIATPTITSPQTWWVRPDGGTPYVNGTQTPVGQCTGLANASYASVGGTTTQDGLLLLHLPGVQQIIGTLGHYESSSGTCTTGNSGQPAWTSSTTTDGSCTWTKGGTYPVGQACAVGNFRYICGPMK